MLRVWCPRVDSRYPQSPVPCQLALRAPLRGVPNWHAPGPWGAHALAVGPGRRWRAVGHVMPPAFLAKGGICPTPDLADQHQAG